MWRDLFFASGVEEEDHYSHYSVSSSLSSAVPIAAAAVFFGASFSAWRQRRSGMSAWSESRRNTFDYRHCVAGTSHERRRKKMTTTTDEKAEPMACRTAAWWIETGTMAQGGVGGEAAPRVWSEAERHRTDVGSGEGGGWCSGQGNRAPLAGLGKWTETQEGRLRRGALPPPPPSSSSSKSLVKSFVGERRGPVKREENGRGGVGAVKDG